MRISDWSSDVCSSDLFCFPQPEDIRIETYGQTALPADMDEWAAFIVELCQEIKNVLGEQKANALSFRMGTEAHNGERFRYTEPNVMLNFYKITEIGSAAWRERVCKSV